MSNRKGEKSRKYIRSSDVTINEYANNNINIRRLKKDNLFVREKKFDKIEDNFDTIDKSAATKKNEEEIDNTIQMYADYSIDIWYIISEHIKPEDVGRFALICRKTADICNTAKFWFHLYHKYYKKLDNIPIRLQPDCMVRHGGLRACVIRSLFYTYDPFILRITPTPKDKYNEVQTETQCLIKKTCIAVWYLQKIDYWQFCFKFITMHPRKRFNKTLAKDGKDESNVEENTTRIDLAAFNDINKNTENHCTILIISTKRFQPLPNFSGQSVNLKSIDRAISHGFLNYKYKLKFSDYRNDNVIDNITFDPVFQIGVYNWWHPNYYIYSDCN